MPSTTLLRIDRLRLRNFRSFAECSVDFHPDITVLVAENGQGKTAVLDAIGIALHVFVDCITSQRLSLGLERGDVRLELGPDGAMKPKLPAQFDATGYVDAQPVTWSRRLASYGPHARNSTNGTNSFRAITRRLLARLESFQQSDESEPPTLPLVAFYGTGRLWSEHRLTKRRSARELDQMGRLAGYCDSLSSSSSFKGFVEWYAERFTAAGKYPASAFGPNERPEMHLAAVREATRTVLQPTGWVAGDWVPSPPTLLGEHPEHGRLPLSRLSDGIRNMVALVADLAHRCARLNPHLGEDAALMTPGILLIDEVDMHLHPHWQQLIIELLRRAFPTMQMIISTHSPQVLSTVDKDSIRVINLTHGEGTIRIPAFQTRGVVSADVLAEIMGVDPVPRVEEALQLSRYRQLIQLRQQHLEEGVALRQALDTHFGHSHPLLEDCDRAIRLEQFKAKLPETRKLSHPND